MIHFFKSRFTFQRLLLKNTFVGISVSETRRFTWDSVTPERFWGPRVVASLYSQGLPTLQVRLIRLSCQVQVSTAVTWSLLPTCGMNAVVALRLTFGGYLKWVSAAGIHKQVFLKLLVISGGATEKRRWPDMTWWHITRSYLVTSHNVKGVQNLCRDAKDSHGYIALLHIEIKTELLLVYYCLRIAKQCSSG